MTEAPSWDLSQLVENAETNHIIDSLREMVAEAETFGNKYRGRIADLEPEGLLKMLERRDELFLRFEGAVKYCHLSYAANSTTLEAKQLSEAVRKAQTEAGQSLAFMDIELSRLLQEKAELIDEPSLKEYKHLLERTAAMAPHLLSETEEKLIMAKDQNGVDAWSQLQMDWLSTRMFTITLDGVESTMPYGEIIGFYDDPRRDLRKRSNEVVYQHLGKDEIVWASALRSICSDHLLMCQRRNYHDPVDPSLLYNDVPRKAIEALMRTVVKNVGLYQRFLKTKARLLGIERLGSWDLRAPLAANGGFFTWDDSRKMVLSSYSQFDAQFANWVEDMFDRQRIDAEIRKGKTSGAFCSNWSAGESAYVLQSYNGRMNDVYTLAHELGHAIHSYLCTRAQVPSNQEIGNCIAECGSIFGELLLTEDLLKNAKSDEEKKTVLAAVLDGFGIATFQVSARYFFERSLYEAIESGKFLDGETISSLWVEARDRIFGDAVDWLPEMNWEWTMKPHYFMANFRFYNYPYVFAQLFVFALYRLYKEQGEAFIPKFKKLLAAGSSESPAQLGADLGFDIRTEEFWQKGMDQAKEFIDQLDPRSQP